MARRPRQAARRGEGIHAPPRCVNSPLSRTAVGQDRGLCLREPQRQGASVRSVPWQVAADRLSLHVPSRLERGVQELLVLGRQLRADRGSLACSRHQPGRCVACRSCRDRGCARSAAPLAKTEAFRERMGWTFEWVSCGADGVFNHDFGAYLTKADLAKEGNNTNYGTRRFTIEDVPAISVFFKDRDGALYHTYSTYSRGLDIFNGAYHYLDIVPKGRDEEKLKYHMDWVRLRDEYS